MHSADVNSKATVMWSCSCSCSELCSRKRSSRWGLTPSVAPKSLHIRAQRLAQTLICHDIKFSVSQMEIEQVSFWCLGLVCESQTRLHCYTGTEKRCVMPISNRRCLAAYMSCCHKCLSVSRRFHGPSSTVLPLCCPYSPWYRQMFASRAIPFVYVMALAPGFQTKSTKRPPEVTVV